MNYSENIQVNIFIILNPSVLYPITLSWLKLTSFYCFALYRVWLSRAIPSLPFSLFIAHVANWKTKIKINKYSYQQTIAINSNRAIKLERNNSDEYF